MIHLEPLLGSHDLVFITLDTLRFDVAQQAQVQGVIPEISSRIPGGAWERRHTPASFTFAAHQAFFAGFLPTPIEPGKHPRLFAARFQGSETTTDQTYCFEEADVVTALRNRGYYSICIGGVGFFNKQTQLGSVLPSLFDESHWNVSLSVTSYSSTQNQVELAKQRIEQQNGPVFLFVNVSALHQPNRMYLSGATEDTSDSQLAALAYTDRWLGELWRMMEDRSPGVCVLCSDHGTAYGENGYVGHRIGHASVWDVPYAEFTY